MVVMTWFAVHLAVIVGGIWLLVVIARWNIPKPPKPPAPEPPAPPAETSPSYVPRWSQHHIASVATDKAYWDEDFDRLLSK